MKFTVSRTSAAALAAALFMFAGTLTAHAQAPDSLTLQSPLDVKAWSVYNSDTKHFLVWLTWRSEPDDVSAFISPADTAGWTIDTPVAQSSYPTVTGTYKGDIDRTITFQSTRAGTVGVDSLIITYQIRKEEYISGKVTLPRNYVPGTTLPMNFINQHTNTPLNLGLSISFSAGKVDALGAFLVGLEDFEGFHIWRGVERDGSDLQIIGEVSKEEAFKGRATGGSLEDSVYFYDIVPTLRTHVGWISPFGSVACLGTRIDLDLDPDGYFWFDCNGTNGFTYYYAVTTFDRGYSPQQGSQGLFKFDHCPVQQGTPYPCTDETVRVPLAVEGQPDLYKVYVVPNPVRTGSSRLTTDNYHGFPDGMVRFVNVPSDCTIRIFTVSGDLVWVHESVGGAGNIEWDTRNLEEQEVTSGVYIYRIERHGTVPAEEQLTVDEQSSVYGRIVVIR